MAIQLDFTWRGVMVPNAYVRIDHIAGGKRENRPTPDHPGEAVWQAVAGIYATAQEPVPILQVGLVVPFVDDQSPFVPLYEALKLLPEFAGATDC